MYLHGSMTDGLVRQIAGPEAAKKIAQGTKKALRECIVLVMKHHRAKEFITGTATGKGHIKDAPTHPYKLTKRYGKLLKSYNYDIVQRELAAYYGSTSEYAAIHEFGGMAGRGRKARIPKRPGLARTIKATEKQIEQIMGDAIMAELSAVDYRGRPAA